MKFQFIEEHRNEFAINRLCQALCVSCSGYYAWRERPVSQREMANQALLQQIMAVHAESEETYGSPRIYRELNEAGVPCSVNRISRLMRQHGIVAIQCASSK